MKKTILLIVGLITIICLSFSILGVNALTSNEWYSTSNWDKLTYYQGDSVSATFTFYSTCPDQLKLTYIGIQFDWMSSPIGYALANYAYLATNNQYAFTAITFTIPASESVGSHSYTVTFQGQQDYTGGFLGIGNGWKDITVTTTGSINVHDAYEKVYNQNVQAVQNSVTTAQDHNYRSPEAQSLLQQAINMYNQATSLANQGQWQAAVDDLNSASSYLSQASAKEALYPTPTPVPTPSPIPTRTPPTPTNSNSDTIWGNLDPDPSPTVPEFPTLGILVVFLGLTIFAVTLLMVRKRKTKN